MDNAIAKNQVESKQVVNVR